MELTEYKNLLEKVQKYVSENYSGELLHISDESTRADYEQKIISRYLIDNGYGIDEVEKLAYRLYGDMSGNGFIDRYRHADMFEEANVNSWEETFVTINGSTFQAPETFISPQNAQDEIGRILSRCGKHIDDAMPIARGQLTDGTRIAAVKTPIVEENVGVVASVRHVSHNIITAEQLLKDRAATEEIIDFLYFCIRYGVSVCFAGATGSAKTTTANWLLSHIPKSKRIITLEEGAREFHLSGQQVISFLTRPSKDKDKNVDLDKLLNCCLWFHPDYIAVGEMYSYEAFTAQEAARTGHTVVTTIHSNSAAATWRRMMTLAQRFPGLNIDNETLMQLMVEAFPIVVYMRHCEDGVRRIMEVREGEDYSAAKGLKSHSIFRFCTENTFKRDDRYIVQGRHRQIGGISDSLKDTLLNNGAPREEIEKYLHPEADAA